MSFFDFNAVLRGHDVYDNNNRFIPRYQLYWSGYTPTQIKSKFNLKDRPRFVPEVKY